MLEELSYSKGMSSMGLKHIHVLNMLRTGVLQTQWLSVTLLEMKFFFETLFKEAQYFFLI